MFKKLFSEMSSISLILEGIDKLGHILAYFPPPAQGIEKRESACGNGNPIGWKIGALNRVGYDALSKAVGEAAVKHDQSPETLIAGHVEGYVGEDGGREPKVLLVDVALHQVKVALDGGGHLGHVAYHDGSLLQDAVGHPHKGVHSLIDKAQGDPVGAVGGLENDPTPPPHKEIRGHVADAENGEHRV